MSTFGDYHRRMMNASYQCERRDTLIHGDSCDIAQEEAHTKHQHMQAEHSKKSNFFGRLLKATKRPFQKHKK